MPVTTNGRFPRQGEIRQKKSLGQVFLNTEWPVKKLVEQVVELGVKRVIEIGPGNGILTLALAGAGISVTAVEKDDRFAEHLKNFTTEDQRRWINVHNADILTFDLPAWIEQGGGVKSAVVGNIPYNISTPIIMWALPHLKKLSAMTFMVQLEFGKRIVSAPDTKDYGSLSVYCQLRAFCDFNFEVKKTCFTPVPKVDSVVITLRPRLDSSVTDKQLQFTETVCRVAFTQRRKKLRNGVKPFMGQLKEENCPIDLNRRAETLTPGDFVHLASFLYQDRF
ncbi:MAG: 16S rRNA (adenine(1518)-N(6)/adenine(1519)-N(6))-dimethyltransferase RsmA [Proteobacteria bacterium]|nr:16S rRNA (adenine(1518)-N(6)/adenine(1519)-N(6))-dimethyltransferase RsmA [Pseudomonadota bacterium]